MDESDAALISADSFARTAPVEKAAAANPEKAAALTEGEKRAIRKQIQSQIPDKMKSLLPHWTELALEGKTPGCCLEASRRQNGRVGAFAVVSREVPGDVQVRFLGHLGIGWENKEKLALLARIEEKAAKESREAGFQSLTVTFTGEALGEGGLGNKILVGKLINAGYESDEKSGTLTRDLYAPEMGLDERVTWK